MRNLIVIIAILMGVSSCSRRAKSLVLQRFGQESLVNNNLVLELRSLQGNHSLGIQCSDQIWMRIIGAEKSIKITLTASPAFHLVQKFGHKGSFCDKQPECHFLLAVSGKGDGKLVISLPSDIADQLSKTNFAVMVMKEPSQTVF
ncbi:MAG: hypothetical protein ABL974_06205 [Prosthecobacter sp.]